MLIFGFVFGFFFNKKVEMTLHTLPAFVSDYNIIFWLIVNINVFNVHGHLLFYSVTYCVDVCQSPVTSRQFGPSDSQNRYTTSLLSPDFVIVLCYTRLLLICDPVEHCKPIRVCVIWRLSFSFHCVMPKELELVDNFIGFVRQWRVRTVFFVPRIPTTDILKEYQ